jgi:hypothetical protein
MVVNGREVRRSQLDVALTHYRDQAMTDLGTQVVVAEAARRAGVAVDDEDLIDQQEAMDPELGLATLTRLRTEILLRKLVLSKVKKAEKDEVYRLFRPDLTGYRLSYIVLQESIDSKALDRDLRAGLPFEKLQATYGKLNPPEITPELLRPLRPEQLWELFGRRGSATVQALPVGKVSPPLSSGVGIVLVRLDAKEDSYEQVEQSLHQVLYEANKNQVVRELAESTFVTTPLTWSATKRKPVHIYGDKVEDLAKPKPKPSATPQASPPATATPLPAKSPSPVAPAETASPTPADRLPDSPEIIGLNSQAAARGFPLVSGSNATIPPIKIKTEAPEFVKGPFNAKIATTTTRLLPGRWKGRGVLRLDVNNNHHADEQEPMLVRTTADGWQPVEKLSASVDRYVLEQDLGYWVDQDVTHSEGPPWARKRVLDRPANGIAEPQEVTLKEFRRSPQLFQNRFELGAEIVRDNQGRLFQHEQTADFGRREAGESDVEHLKSYRDSDENWEVPVESLNP